MNSWPAPRSDELDRPTSSERSSKLDFAVVGGQFDGYYYLWASKELTYAELKYTVETREIRDYGLSRPVTTNVEYDIKVGTRSMVMIVGTSYAQAFADLFRIWSPDRETSQLQLPTSNSESQLEIQESP